MERATTYIDKEMIANAILDTIYNSNGVIHQYLLTFILDQIDTRYKEGYMSILVSIASGRNKQAEISRGLRVAQGEISKALTRLTELGFIARNGVFYRIEDSELEFWLKFVYERRRAMLVDGILNKGKIFEEEIASYIANFLQDLETANASRIAELFNLCSNDLVSIDSKHVRLPHFTKTEIRPIGQSRPFIVASFRGRLWVAQVHEDRISENDIIDYIRNIKMSGHRIANKIVIPLKDMDENSKLLAKELKISIWDISVVNTLLNLYGKKRIVIL